MWLNTGAAALLYTSGTFELRTQPVKVLDGLDGHGRCVSPAPDPHSRNPVLVYPSDLPPAILHLERKHIAHIDLIAHAKARARDDTQRHRERVAGRPDELLHALAQNVLERGVQRGVVGRLEQARGEVEHALAEVVARAVDVCAVRDQPPYEREGMRELVAAPVGVEEVEDVDRDDGVEARELAVEVGLSVRVGVIDREKGWRHVRRAGRPR